MSMPVLSWSRVVEGCHSLPPELQIQARPRFSAPDVLLGTDRILLNFGSARNRVKTYRLAADGKTLLDCESTRNRVETLRLLCFDFDGRLLWTRKDLMGWLSLPGGKYLVGTVADEPQIIDADGDVLYRWELRRWRNGGIRSMAQYGELIVLADDRQVWGINSELKPEWTFIWPTESVPEIRCFVNGAFYWNAGDEIKVCTTSGRADTFAPIPNDLIAESQKRYLESIGRNGKRIFNFGASSMSFDHSRKLFFLGGGGLPHMVLCLDDVGRPKWCVGLGTECCGGSPYLLPNGLYVTSGGCNATVSWLDANGTVVLQSLPGLALGGYGDKLQILPDGRILATGAFGLDCFSMEGEYLWKSEGMGHDYQCDSARHVLVSCSYEKSKSGEEMTTYLHYYVFDPEPEYEPIPDIQTVSVPA